MKLKKILSAVGILFIFLMSFSEFNVFAQENTGLITKCSLSCEECGNGKLKISAKTQASGIMSEIGFENITIQYSDDGLNWYDEKNIGTMIQYNASHYCIDGITTDVSGGHLYRIVCTHTATGNLFMSSETFTQTAVHSSKYISASQNETYHSDNNYDSTTTDIQTTVSTTSTTALSTTSSHTSTSFSTVSTSSTTVTTTEIQQQDNTSSDSGSKIYTIYEYFGNDSPVTGVTAPIASLFALVVSIIIVAEIKKK